VEFPSNLLLRVIGPRIYIPLLVFSWGLVTCMQGFVKSYHGMLVARIFLGICQGGIFPAIVLYIGRFYTRRRIQLRIATFYLSQSLSGAFSGLLTFLIMKMDGYRNLSGWNWVFIVEGFFTCVVAILGYFILPSTLETAKLLSEAEKRAVAIRLKQENFDDSTYAKSATANSRKRSSKFQAWKALKSPHMLLVAIASFMQAVMGHSLSTFMPTIVKSFGYSSSQTQLLTIPVYAVAAIGCVLPLSYLADRYQTRGIPTCFCTLLSLMGFVIFYASNDNHVRYGSLFLSLSGVYGAIPCLTAWMANNSEPYTRKEVTVAIGPCLRHFGGLAAVWIFSVARTPRYALPAIIGMTFSLGVLLCTVLNMLWLAHATRAKVTRRQEILAKFMSPEGGDAEGKVPEDIGPIIGGLTVPNFQAARAWDELGDKHPDFKYCF